MGGELSEKESWMKLKLRHMRLGRLLFAAAALSCAGPLSADPAAQPVTEIVAPLRGVDIWSALAFENADALRRLIAQGVDVNKPDELSLITPAMVAESFPLAKILVDAGADVTAKDRFGHSVLHYAVRMRDAASIIPLYASHGADPNARSGTGVQSTPLMAAIYAYLDDRDLAHADAAIRALLAAGADLNAQDRQGQTALAIVAARADAPLVKLLLSLGADPSLKLADGRTIAELARGGGSTEAARMLEAAVAAKAAPNQRRQ